MSDNNPNLSDPNNGSGGEMAPVNPITPVVVVLFLAMVFAELAFTLGAAGYVGGPQAVGWRLAYVQQYAFSGEIFDWMIENNRWPFDQVIRTVTFPFVHSSFTHAAIGSVMMLALGKMVGDAYGAIAAVVLFFVPCALGAIIFAISTESAAPLLGAFTAVYGYVGAYTYLMWIKLGNAGQPQIRAFALIGFLMLAQLVFGLLYSAGPIWIADIAAFVVGFGLSVLLAPGGWSRLLARLRRRA